MVSQVRPKRALQRRLPFRPAALAVPAVIIGLLGSGAAVSAWSPVSADAQPAVVTAPASGSPLVTDRTDRASRMLDEGRPALNDSATPAAADREAEAKAAQAKAQAKAKAEAEAKADQRAADRAADKKAAEKKAARKEAREQAAERAAAAKEKAAKRRAAEQRATPSRAQLEVSGHRYTRANLNVRIQPSNSARLVTVLAAGRGLAVTETTRGSWTLVIHQDQGRWVRTRYLTATKPEPKTAEAKRTSSGSASKASTASSSGLSMAPCPSGSGMESGLTRDAVRVHRAVCDRFPQITSYGGMRSGGGSFHTSGRAVDIMVSGETGWEIARWVRSNRKQLGVSEIIYAQKIWTVQRSGEGWRPMASRGNPTANHYDHVHVSVYGNTGTS